MSTESHYYENAVFWLETDKIKPNPYQPRKEFAETELRALSESIRQYGVLQALVVTRKEFVKPDGGIGVEYELIAGERRLRAARLAGIREVPALIKTGDESNLMKLELAIIENVQREDLNAVDRARAFQRLVEEFHFKHAQIAEKVGKSREYVTNSLRILSLPAPVLEALSKGDISEGHARPLGMLNDRPEEQTTLLKEILYKKLTVREAEAIARRIAVDKVRKKDKYVDPEMSDLEHKLAESLGTRVQIERREQGGKVVIDFFSPEDLRSILDIVRGNRTGQTQSPTAMMDRHAANQEAKIAGVTADSQAALATADAPVGTVDIEVAPTDDRTPKEIAEAEDQEDLYSIKNFSI